MKNIIKAVKRSKPVKAVVSFLVESANCLAPYTVHNAQTGKQHACWSHSEAMAWLRCYNPRKFGRTEILNFHGEPIAATYC